MIPEQEITQQKCEIAKVLKMTQSGQQHLASKNPSDYFLLCLSFSFHTVPFLWFIYVKSHFEGFALTQPLSEPLFAYFLQDIWYIS